MPKCLWLEACSCEMCTCQVGINFAVLITGLNKQSDGDLIIDLITDDNFPLYQLTCNVGQS